MRRMQAISFAAPDAGGWGRVMGTAHNLLNELEAEKSHADAMVNMAAYWMDRAQRAEQLAAILVYAGGGRIEVHRDHLIDAHRLVLVRTENPVNMSTRFRAHLQEKT